MPSGTSVMGSTAAAVLADTLFRAQRQFLRGSSSLQCGGLSVRPVTALSPPFHAVSGRNTRRPRSHVSPSIIERSSSTRRGFSLGSSQSSPVRQTAAIFDGAPATTFKVGQKLHGWTCRREEHVQEFNCTGYLFEHDRSGAELISMVQPADENKTFGVVFRTPPENSNGIAHVLEHSVLCGSRKYPIKEPFVELLKSSVQTFLNAMTFPDRTCYPVASCNLRDFYNLIDVYLDAVLHPRAVKDPRVLAQEGWHYEIENKDDPLIYKGVVFNEMKGVYSSPDSAHSRLSNQSLFPNSVYGVDSGGDPKVIPSLDFEYMKNYHAKYYHPSNAKFWFYGDDPAEERLALLDRFLSEFERIDVDSQIVPQPLFQEPKRVLGEFPVGEDEDTSKKTMVSVSWVLEEGKADLQTSLALGFLNYLMMGTEASPLYKALVDSGLGSQVIGGGLYEGLLQPVFSVGLKDLREEDVPRVEELVMTTLGELEQSGFDDDAVKAAINTIEFQNRELNTGTFPKGLALMFAAIDNWNYDKDPFEPLRFEAPLIELKERLAKGERIFEMLIREKLLNNCHKIVVESRPSKEYAKKLEEAEKAELEKHRSTLDQSRIEALIEETKTLKEMQEKPDDPEDLKVVPRLELADIPREVPKVPTEALMAVIAPGPVTLVHALPTSGVVYTDVAFSLAGVSDDLIPLLPMFTKSLKSLGTAKGDFVSLTRRIGTSTGGISASNLCMNRYSSTDPAMYLIVRGKSMASQIGELADLLKEILLTVDWTNKERFVQLLEQAKAGARSGLVTSGHIVAAKRLAAQTTVVGRTNERMSGLSQFEYLTSLSDEIESGGWEAVSARLQKLQAAIFNSASCAVVNVTTNTENVLNTRSALDGLVAALPSSSVAGTEASDVTLSPALGRAAEGIVVPTQVNYVGKGANLYDGGIALHGSFSVISKFLGTTYLWDRVRVSGGAYGGFCSFDQRSGDFRYLSYRDPNLAATWENYDGTPQFLRDLQLDDDELSKAIIGCMGDVDTYLLPDAKGYQAMLRHLLGEDDDFRQRLRDQILSSKVDDFRSFAAALDVVAKGGGLCVVGSKDAIEAVTDEYGLSVTSPLAAVGIGGVTSSSTFAE
eukprot:TRINITY_DN67626_c0_g1_i1.p1 TRINITY_DN67626_c0_g1~~TRINITY_DN67626_c0_g1_i1.p1  ORF type:complete len:1109 (+),score=206.75 TRINITY_DN67626_c0_g1_i1:89-3415(+)